MRITLATTETKVVSGLFKKIPAWEVVCKIDFSEEEKAILRAQNPSRVYVYTRQFGPNMPPSDMTLANVLKDGIENRFTTPVEAKQFETALRDEILPSIKNYITASTTVSSEPQTFEL